MNTKEQFNKYTKKLATIEYGTDGPTPILLVEEILDNLPLDWDDRNLRICDPCFGFGTFLYFIYLKLLKYYDEAHILNNMLHGYEIEPFRYELTKKKLNIKNLYNLNSLGEINMNNEFDLTLGNPPFDSEHGVNSHSLWTPFIELMHRLTKKDTGLVASIHPHIGRRKIKQKFFENDVLVYKPIGVGKYFEDSGNKVGSTFCWTITRMSNTDVETTVLGEKNDIVGKYDLNKFDFIPGEINDDIVDMLEDLLNGTPLNINTTSGIHSQKKEFFSDTQSKDFPHKYQHTSSQIKYGLKPCKAMDSNKVVCSKSGYLKPWYDENGIGVTEGSWIIPVDNKVDAMKIINFLKSDEVKLFNKITGSNTGAHDPNKYKMLCMK
jgi:hypothetical protein